MKSLKESIINESGTGFRPIPEGWSLREDNGKTYFMVINLKDAERVGQDILNKGGCIIFPYHYTESRNQLNHNRYRILTPQERYQILTDVFPLINKTKAKEIKKFDFAVSDFPQRGVAAYEKSAKTAQAKVYEVDVKNLNKFFNTGNINMWDTRRTGAPFGVVALDRRFIWDIFDELLN